MKMSELERQLRADAKRWRIDQMPLATTVSSSKPGRWRPLAAAAAVFLVVGGGAVVAESTQRSHGTGAAAAAPATRVVPSLSAAAPPEPSSAAAATPGPGPSMGVTGPSSGRAVYPAGRQAQLLTLLTARERALAALLPEQMSLGRDEVDGLPDGGVFSSIAYREGSLSLTAVWNRIPVPVSSSAISGMTSRSSRPDGTVVLMRDELDSPEVLVANATGDSVDLTVVGDTQRNYDITRLTSLASTLLASR